MKRNTKGKQSEIRVPDMNKTIDDEARHGKVLQISVHAFRAPILCRGISCTTEFLPTRKDQVFCSVRCRQRYFSIARVLGLQLLDESKSDQEIQTFVRRYLMMLEGRQGAE